MVENNTKRLNDLLFDKIEYNLIIGLDQQMDIDLTIIAVFKLWDNINDKIEKVKWHE